jgi:hypothetical protein
VSGDPARLDDGVSGDPARLDDGVSGKLLVSTMA